MKNRIAELRAARGWSMRDLASHLNTSASTVNKLEKGQTQLTLHWMERLSRAFAVPVGDLLENAEPTSSGMREDVAPFSPRDQRLSEIKLNDAQFFYEVRSDALDQIGITPGSALVVDTSPEAMAALRSGDAVIAQIYEGMSAVTILRQFIEPSLLITNSLRQNAPTINLRTEDAAIKGVVMSSHRLYRLER